MKKDVTCNIYPDAWINKNNQLVISDAIFDVDLTQLLPGSTLDEDGYLISKDGKKYDLNDADVIATIGLNDIELSDDMEVGQVSGNIVSIVYKGDHYQVMVRTEEEEDFIVDTLYSWNENDTVRIDIKKEDISLQLKGDINKYEVQE